MPKIVDRIAQRVDSWYNSLTGLGNALRDKREWSYFVNRNRLSDQLLENMFHGDDLAARICEALPSEALRKGFYLSAENDDPELSSKLAEYEKRLGFRKEIKKAAIWSRVFGGAVLYLGIDDGQEEDQPVNTEAIKSLRWVQTIDKRYIIPKSFYTDVDRYGEPEVYEIQQELKPSANGPIEINAGMQIHESRLLRFDGALTTQTRQDQNNGWSDSVLEKVYEVVRDFGTSWQSIGYLLQDASQGVFKVDGLIEAMASGQRDALTSRMQLISMSRSVARAIMLDAEKEDFHRESYTFQGVPDIMKMLMLRLASAARMPVIVLMGQSPSGLNATGESDIRLWYDKVQEYQTDALQDPITRFYELVFAAQDFDGIEPDAWQVNFERLWQMTDKEQAELERFVAEKDKVYIDSGVVLPEEIATNRFKARGFSMDTQIDLDARQEMLEAEIELAKDKAGQEPTPPPMVPGVPGSAPNGTTADPEQDDE